MKTHTLLLTLLSFTFYSSHAQVYKKETLYAGESVAAKSTYLFPAFTNAVVKLKNGDTINSTMNFNLLTSEIQFIDSDKDTLELIKPKEVDSIIFDSTSFFYNSGFYQVLATSSNASLVVLRTSTYAPLQIGTLGLPTSTGFGIQTFGSIMTPSGIKNLLVNIDVECTTATTHFLIGTGGEMIKVNKADFIKIFPSKETAIQTYLKQNKIDFNKETDIEKLFAYCSSQ